MIIFLPKPGLFTVQEVRENRLFMPTMPGHTLQVGQANSGQSPPENRIAPTLPPDLALSDLCLFDCIERVLQEVEFPTAEELLEAIVQIPSEISLEILRDTFSQWGKAPGMHYQYWRIHGINNLVFQKFRLHLKAGAEC
jgi:hypothetical protein